MMIPKLYGIQHDIHNAISYGTGQEGCRKVTLPLGILRIHIFKTKAPQDKIGLERIH